MKFKRVLIVTGLSLSVWSETAAAASVESEINGSAKPLAELILDLADEKFRIREDATRKIWAIGESALPALQEIADGKDPEQAYRARELIGKIELDLTPDTDPAVMALVERYAKATSEEKHELFGQLYRKRAWRQILKLYAGETDVEIQNRLQRHVEGVAVIAARECLEDDDADKAREFLELAPANAAGLLALADFHRSQGTLEAELARAKTLEGVKAEAWRLALYRAAGNLEAARDSAKAAGEIKISAIMSALLGDPLPWLWNERAGSEGEGIHDAPRALRLYTDLAIRRWQGLPVRPSDLEPLMRSVNSKSRSVNGVNSLFLLGETALAEEAHLRKSPMEAFAYFDTLERIPEAMTALGIDPEKPDYAAWVAKRLDRLAKDDAPENQELTMDFPELLILANFLERRGLHPENADAFLKPLAELAENDPKLFMEFLGPLFGGGPADGGPPADAPQLARRAAVAWAGENDERWDDVIFAAFGGQEEMMVLWEWLLDLNPTASRVERLDGMLALCGLGRDPQRLREKWLGLAWETIRKTPGEKRTPLLLTLIHLSRQNSDVANNLKLWDELPGELRNEIQWRTHILDLTAVGRWDEAATIYVNLIDQMSKARQDFQPWLRACAAACLRKAGRAEEAAAQDALVEKLALGNNALEIAEAYAEGYDYQRAAEWGARAVRQGDSTTHDFSKVLHDYIQMALEQRNWTQVAAISEVCAQIEAAVDSSSKPAIFRLRIRLQADLGKALVNLKSDPAGSIATLGKCHGMFISDGTLADDFFPAVRQAGLLREHDEWFQISWDRLTDVIAKFPGSDNTRNTAAWLASRARQNLIQAQEFAEIALAANPNQSSYLDTMAEIQFAKGNRNKALEWSAKAVNFTLGDLEGPLLRRQFERFRTAALPR